MNATAHPTEILAPAGTHYLEVVREFDAPPAAVYRASTDPELVVRWLGPRDLDMHVERWDVRPGGGYRYLHRRGDMQAWFHGVYHQVTPDELIVQTFEFEGVPDEVALETTRFEDLGDGRCRLVTHSVFSTEAVRDAAVASGMEHGIRDSMDRLGELLAG